MISWCPEDEIPGVSKIAQRLEAAHEGRRDRLLGVLP